MTLLGNGNVGIGTTSPAAGYKLDVAGNINSALTVNQETYPSINASQTASDLQNGSAFTGTDATMATMYQAVQFTASDAHTMGDFTVRVKESADITNTTGYITGYIYADDGGSPSKPTGAALATGNSVKFGTLTTSYQILSMGTSYTMVSGTKYWLVLKYSAAPTGGNIVLDSDASSNMGATSADGASWTNTDVRLRYVIRGRTYYGGNFFSTNSSGVYGSSTNNTGVLGSSTNNTGVYGNSTNYIGVYGSSTNNTGVYGSSTNSSGVYGGSTNSVGGYLSTNPATTDTVAEVLRLRRQTSGAATDGIGGSMDFYTEDSAGTDELTGRIGNLLTTATSGNETSALTFWTRNAGAAIAERLRIDGSGNVGIGTTSPAELLDVNGRLRLAQTTAPATTTDKLYNVSGNLFWNGVDLTAGGSALPSGTEGQTLYNNGGTWTATSDLFYDDINGRVGIGNAAPAEKLDLTGNFKASGTGRFGDLFVDGVVNGFYNTASGQGYYGFAAVAAGGARPLVLKSGNGTTAFALDSQTYIGASNPNPYGIVNVGGYFWIPRLGEAKIYKYNSDLSYSGVSMDLNANNTDSYDVTYGGGYFWIIDDADDRIYRYDADFGYIDYFDLESGHDDVRGVAYYDGYLWITDLIDDKIYKYTTAGAYTGISYSLYSQNLNSRGIEYYDGYFWIADYDYSRIYKYETNGNYTGTYFSVGAGGMGICYYNGYFWIASFGTDTVYSYVANVYSGGYIALSTDGSERLSIDNSGNVGIGTLAGSGNRAVYSDADGVLTNSSSDIRLKINIGSIADEMDVIGNLGKLRGVYYNWDTTVDAAKNLGAQREIGMIAQEVQAVMPELVGQNAGGYLSLDYPKFTAYLLEVAKNQQSQIDSISLQLTEQGLINSTTTVDSAEESENSLLAKVRNILESLGLAIYDGVANLRRVVVETFSAKTARVEQLEMVDKATGEIYCTWIENGVWEKTEGACDAEPIQNTGLSESPETGSAAGDLEDNNGQSSNEGDPAPAGDSVENTGSSDGASDEEEGAGEEGAPENENDEGDAASGAAQETIDPAADGEEPEKDNEAADETVSEEISEEKISEEEISESIGESEDVSENGESL